MKFSTSFFIIESTVSQHCKIKSVSDIFDHKKRTDEYLTKQSAFSSHKKRKKKGQRFFGLELSKSMDSSFFEWLLHPQDLMSNDIFLWGYLKTRVYNRPSHSIEEDTANYERLYSSPVTFKAAINVWSGSITTKKYSRQTIRAAFELRWVKLKFFTFSRN